jgi:hypothetical protein
MKRVFWKYTAIVALASLVSLSACNKKDNEPTIPEFLCILAFVAWLK